MRPCFAVEMTTPKKFVLRGLWFGPTKPKRAIVWVHGLGSTAFSMSHVVTKLIDTKTAVLTFNNRGHGIVNKLQSANKKVKAKLVGAAHEVFTDCVDDIQGAINFVRKQSVKNIYLAGQSTGCQKSMYWASRKKGGRGVRGIILLAPISDWAAETKRKGKQKMALAAAAARALVARGKKHELLPSGLWHEVLDAQRFLSLYTPSSVEEIFSYAQQKKDPRTLKGVKIPILTFWAAKDEYADRKANEVAKWFTEHVSQSRLRFVTIPAVSHGFKGAERNVAQAVKRWMEDSKK